MQFLESLVVADLVALPEQHSTLSVFTNENGGIIDDTIVNKQRDHFYVVSNAGCADKDWNHLIQQASAFRQRGKDVRVSLIDDQSLLALQGMTYAILLI
jgi:aminomethyltransferase